MPNQEVFFRVSLGHRSIGFLESEIQEWIMARIKERDMAG
ncbi:AlpA family phage regulatory protein [Pseudomonas aeruginosa]|nr:AlpA family phage regulatory protein [Pseudomonas aeruginosa]MDI3653199.1 AlpA family phage regulatory protein [Pseudomonas aeruginosa]WRH80819.1 AlpA family phage regulatory protein [Pseudomonas aeruginosa]